MKFVLIPFLLATNLISNDDAWNNGPEYSFLVSFNTFSNVSESKAENPLTVTSLITTLKCRPREPDNLNCHFEDTKIGELPPDLFYFSEPLLEKNVNYKPFGASEANFEIKFDRNGIEGYIFEKDEKLMGQFLIDIFRVIANQLSVGTNLDDKGESFRTKEDFTIGKCTTEYKIFRSDIENECMKKKFNLVSLTDYELHKEELLHIERERMIDECDPLDICYFSARNTSGIVLSEHTDKLVSSMSNMVISTDYFLSETFNVVDVYDKDKKIIGRAVDRVRVTLESIDPAQGSLKSISGPTSVDVIIRNSSYYDTHSYKTRHN